MSVLKRWFLLVTLAGLGWLAPEKGWAAGMKAGLARVKITPPGPIWLSGYANRNKPSEGAVHDLWAKAVAIEDERGGRTVIVTTDLIGLPRAMSDVVGARVQKEHGLDRARLVLNSSHTHSGPVVRPNLSSMYDLSPEQTKALEEYARTLTDALVSLTGSAIGDLGAAELSFGSSEAGFVMNRREFTAKGVRLGVNPNGPVDRSVPVIRVMKGGALKAVLFGYACHNTTLGGDIYRVNGDYAGFAQLEWERAHPGATALFLMLCGGDANPNPRGKMEHAEQHGKELAAAVDKALNGTPMTRLEGRIRAVFQLTDLPLESHSRDDFEKMLNDPNVYRRRLAKSTLEAYDQRRPLRKVPYPVQGVRIGRDFTLLALGGEVVVEYALWAKKEWPRQRMIVAGYSNDVMCYIPTAKMLEEKGYEPVDSMVYYGMPAPFAPEVEQGVKTAVQTVMKRLK